MLTFRFFADVQSARDYRHANGTGGWIFAIDNPAPDRHYTEPAVILFPPGMTPSAIVNHSLVRGLSGRLICNA